MRRGGAATGGPSSADFASGGDSNGGTTKIGISTASNTSGISAVVSCKSEVQWTMHTFEIWSAVPDGGMLQPSHVPSMSGVVAVTDAKDARSMKHPASATLTCANASSARRTRAIRRLSRAGMGSDCT